MVKIEQFSKKSVNKMKGYLTKYSKKPEGWNGKRFWGYLDKIDPDSLENKPLPLCITYTVPDDMDADGLKKSLRKFKNKLKYYYNDAEVVSKLEFDQSGKVYAQMILGGDGVPSKEWVLDTLKEDYQHDAPRS